MKPIKWLLLVVLIILIILLFLLYWCWVSHHKHEKETIAKNFINWNLVFNEQLTHVQRDLLAKRIIHDINIVSNSGPINSNDSFSVYFNHNFYDSLRVQAHGHKFRLDQCKRILLPVPGFSALEPPCRSADR